MPTRARAACSSRDTGNGSEEPFCAGRCEEVGGGPTRTGVASDCYRWVLYQPPVAFADSTDALSVNSFIARPLLTGRGAVWDGWLRSAPTERDAKSITCCPSMTYDTDSRANGYEERCLRGVFHSVQKPLALAVYSQRWSTGCSSWYACGRRTFGIAKYSRRLAFP